ncbi:MAG: hypothetical protein PVG66_10130 [Chromatiales bacterium]|jgi:hypothetical protein
MEIDSSSILFLTPDAIPGKSGSSENTALKNQQNQSLQHQQLVRDVSDAEKQSASRQFEDSLSRQRQPNLTQDQPGLRQSQAINAYQETEQGDQKQYLSEVLGVDLRA